MGRGVTVISEDARDDYFGKGVPAVGKTIETDNILYRVCGVVKSVARTQSFAFADMWVPYSLSKSNLHSTGLTGGYNGVLLLASKADISKAQEEYQQMVSRMPTDGKAFDRVLTRANTYLELFSLNAIDDHSGKVKLGAFFLLAGILFFLFLLLPTLNLVNINISRIMDRSSEIGVRKAFGASSVTLVYQFVVENLILTFMGGAIGVTLSLIIIRIINYRHPIDNLTLSVNVHVLLFGVFACLVFGLLSGVYPAWRMSRMQVVTALKAQ